MYSSVGLKRCKKCRSEMLKKDKFCLHCGKKFVNKVEVVSLSLLVMLIVFIMIKII